MKKSMLLIISLFAGLFSAFAQEVPDTVRVIAYWNLGDKYHYQVEESQFKVNNRTDTVDVRKSAHLLTLEVIEATDTTYRVRVFSDDYQDSDYDRSAMVDDLTDQFGNLPFEFVTDELGVFNRVIISEEDWLTVYPILDSVVDSMTEGKELKDEEREKIRQMVRAMYPKERIEQLYAEEFSPLLQFHGLWMIPGEEVEYETEAPSVFGDGSVVKMNGRFWADEELTDDYSVVVRDEMEADEEDMRKYLGVFFGKAFDAITEDESTREELNSMLEKAEITVLQSVDEEIHLSSGWPIFFRHEKYVHVKGIEENQEQEQVTTKSVSIILED
ncbi:MAG: hypothetical protein IKG84_00765 [Bacteroidales bacterium]|nr:hypothetical protein [Bacteroidales bacterium]